MSFIFFDDKKQKHQSIEAQIEGAGQYYDDLYALEDLGYGSTQEEASEDIIRITKKNVEKLKQMTAFLQEQIDKHESNRNFGSPRNG